MIITVASGKGGTGKTTLATSLALALAEEQPVLLRDCDVEAPNAHIFLRPTLGGQESVGIPIPMIDPQRCTGCGACVEVCQYHALLLLAGRVILFAELCHGCGSCLLNCPEGAIHESLFRIGSLQHGLAEPRVEFIHGRLDIGQPMAVPIIREIKRWQPASAVQIEMRDAPPGISCPVVASLLGSDYVILVTEPTPFGLHDLKLAAGLVAELGLPAGVVINRDGLGTAPVEAFCAESGLPILLRVPLQRQIAIALAEGQPLVHAFPEYQPRLIELYQRCCSLAQAFPAQVQP